MSNRSFRGIKTLRFSEFELDVRACELRRDGARVKLQEQPLRILTALLEKPGEIITREEIRRRLWPNDTVVEVSHGINAAVQRLREALGESAESPRFVETLARRGYRFIGSVEIGVRTPSGASSPEREPEPEERPPDEVSHFRVLERLGVGGMGVVYRAEDQKLGRNVALKFLPEALAKDPAALARFRREAQAASALNHPNICTIYGVEECDGKPVIVMEYIEGESLESMLKRGPIPVDRALGMAIQIASALDAAHRKGIVHRDLKPGNVFANWSGVKVLDFGLAKMERPPALGFEPPHVTREGAILGTLHYLSPEQAQGEPAEPRSDIFSFGVVLYEMLAGRRTFDGPNAAKVMAAILALEPAPLGGAVPPALELAVRRCLAKHPDERWQSARDLKAALESISLVRESALREPLPQFTPAIAPSVAAAPPVVAAPARLGIRWSWLFVAAVALAWGAWYLGVRRALWMQPAAPHQEPHSLAATPTKKSTGPPIASEPSPPAAPGHRDPLEASSSAPEAQPRTVGGQTKSADGQTKSANGQLKTIGVATRLPILLDPSNQTSTQLTGLGATRVAISPDGKRIAYINRRHLWISGINGEKPVSYDEASGAPFWSPDGKYVAAQGSNKMLRRFELGTQNTRNICAVDTSFPGAWNQDGTILIGLQHDGIYRVDAQGGALERVTALDAARGEGRHFAPKFLPDGKRYIYVAGSMTPGQSMLYGGTLDSPQRVEIMPVSSNVQFAARPGSADHGYLVYQDGEMMARAFNWRTMKVDGPAIRLGEIATSDQAANTVAHYANYSVSGDEYALSDPRSKSLMLVKNWMKGLK
jgi:DNA-binding winged helix-turn-helix (wHTH) protein/predicted Ser/Thr protein kinase